MEAAKLVDNLPWQSRCRPDSAVCLLEREKRAQRQLYLNRADQFQCECICTFHIYDQHRIYTCCCSKLQLIGHTPGAHGTAQKRPPMHRPDQPKCHAVIGELCSEEHSLHFGLEASMTDPQAWSTAPRTAGRCWHAAHAEPLQTASRRCRQASRHTILAPNQIGQPKLMIAQPQRGCKSRQCKAQLISCAPPHSRS